MNYFLGLLVLWTLCQNTFARGLDNLFLNDFERRLVRLEAWQFSESENLEHRLLQLETRMGTQKEEETLEQNFYEISKVEKENPSEGMTFLQRLENVEKNWEKAIEEQLALFSSKYENLSERFSAIEKNFEEHKTSALDQVMERLSTPPEESKNGKTEEDKAQVVGHTEEDKPQVIGHTEEDKPQVIGHTEEDKPQVIGHTEEDKPQVIGHTEEDKPQVIRSKLYYIGLWGIFVVFSYFIILSNYRYLCFFYESILKSAVTAKKLVFFK